MTELERLIEQPKEESTEKSAADQSENLNTDLWKGPIEPQAIKQSQQRKAAALLLTMALRPPSLPAKNEEIHLPPIEPPGIVRCIDQPESMQIPPEIREQVEAYLRENSEAMAEWEEIEERSAAVLTSCDLESPTAEQEEPDQTLDPPDPVTIPSEPVLEGDPRSEDAAYRAEQNRRWGTFISLYAEAYQRPYLVKFMERFSKVAREGLETDIWLSDQTLEKFKDGRFLTQLEKERLLTVTGVDEIRKGMNAEQEASGSHVKDPLEAFISDAALFSGFIETAIRQNPVHYNNIIRGAANSKYLQQPWELAKQVRDFLTLIESDPEIRNLFNKLARHHFKTNFSADFKELMKDPLVRATYERFKNSADFKRANEKLNKSQESIKKLQEEQENLRNKIKERHDSPEQCTELAKRLTKVEVELKTARDKGREALRSSIKAWEKHAKKVEKAATQINGALDQDEKLDLIVKLLAPYDADKLLDKNPEIRTEALKKLITERAVRANNEAERLREEQQVRDAVQDIETFGAISNAAVNLMSLYDEEAATAMAHFSGVFVSTALALTTRNPVAIANAVNSGINLLRFCLTDGEKTDALEVINKNIIKLFDGLKSLRDVMIQGFEDLHAHLDRIEGTLEEITVNSYTLRTFAQHNAKENLRIILNQKNFREALAYFTRYHLKMQQVKCNREFSTEEHLLRTNRGKELSPEEVDRTKDTALTHGTFTCLQPENTHSMWEFTPEKAWKDLFVVMLLSSEDTRGALESAIRDIYEISHGEFFSMIPNEFQPFLLYPQDLDQRFYAGNEAELLRSWELQDILEDIYPGFPEARFSFSEARDMENAIKQQLLMDRIFRSPRVLNAAYDHYCAAMSNLLMQLNYDIDDALTAEKYHIANSINLLDSTADYQFLDPELQRIEYYQKNKLETVAEYDKVDAGTPGTWLPTYCPGESINPTIDLRSIYFNLGQAHMFELDEAARRSIGNVYRSMEPVQLKVVNTVRDAGGRARNTATKAVVYREKWSGPTGLHITEEGEHFAEGQYEFRIHPKGEPAAFDTLRVSSNAPHYWQKGKRYYSAPFRPIAAHLKVDGNFSNTSPLGPFGHQVSKDGLTRPQQQILKMVDEGKLSDTFHQKFHCRGTTDLAPDAHRYTKSFESHWNNDLKSNVEKLLFLSQNLVIKNHPGKEVKSVHIEVKAGKVAAAQVSFWGSEEKSELTELKEQSGLGQWDFVVDLSLRSREKMDQDGTTKFYEGYLSNIQEKITDDVYHNLKNYELSESANSLELAKQLLLRLTREGMPHPTPAMAELVNSIHQLEDNYSMLIRFQIGSRHGVRIGDVHKSLVENIQKQQEEVKGKLAAWEKEYEREGQALKHGNPEMWDILQQLQSSLQQGPEGFKSTQNDLQAAEVRTSLRQFFEARDQFHRLAVKGVPFDAAGGPDIWNLLTDIFNVHDQQIMAADEKLDQLALGQKVEDSKALAEELSRHAAELRTIVQMLEDTVGQKDAELKRTNKQTARVISSLERYHRRWSREEKKDEHISN
jgi:gas vesicle protein